MSALDDLIMLLGGMVERNVPDAQQALDMAYRVAEEELTPAEVLDALAPGTKVRDKDGDKWRKRKDGLWRFKNRRGHYADVPSDRLLDIYGPVQVIPWKGKK